MGQDWACHWAGKRDRNESESDDGQFTLLSRAERRRERHASDET